MKQIFDSTQRRELTHRGFSRRDFGRLAALLTAGSALPFYNEFALAQGLSAFPKLPPDAVRLNANENPMGPCPEAAEAIHKVVQRGGRYMYEETFAFVKLLAELEGLPREYVLAFAGSSDPLHRAVLAFTSPGRSFVVADPGYEAGERAAKFVGARTVKVPLRKDASHDAPAMAKADPGAGLIYVCNPNNPTGSITRKEDIEYLVANKPEGAVVLLDEAYIHISQNAEPGTPLVAANKDVIVLRTFSKLYGMAGLRRRGDGPPGPARENQRFRGRGLARDRHGWRHRQPEGQGSCSEPAQDHRRHPRRDGRMVGQAGLLGFALGSQHDHDRRSAPGSGLPSSDARERKGGDRPGLAVDAESRAGHDRHARRDGQVPCGVQPGHECMSAQQDDRSGQATAPTSVPGRSRFPLQWGSDGLNQGGSQRSPGAGCRPPASSSELGRDSCDNVAAD